MTVFEMSQANSYINDRFQLELMSPVAAVEISDHPQRTDQLDLILVVRLYKLHALTSRWKSAKA